MKRQVRNRRRQEFVRRRLVELGYDVWQCGQHGEWRCAIRRDRFDALKILVQCWIDEAQTPQAKAKAQRQLERLEANGVQHIAFMSHSLGDHFNTGWRYYSWKKVAARLRAHGNSPRQFVLVQDW